uniref:Intraflagellar transport protein 80 homolog isoform X1 n=2 Tax=Petromyzon marinus TaxID=7757 RepID=A0AAJ7XID1_PETMA|nr:intraflagellar transport protein 80 homolog isoform X1 [Petromyzon marinus]XP_032834383.1 intraflagellar transport protein 80 homolog isoform X1 [Petromyzon marinus]
MRLKTFVTKEAKHVGPACCIAWLPSSDEAFSCGDDGAALRWHRGARAAGAPERGGLGGDPEPLRWGLPEGSHPTDAHCQPRAAGGGGGGGKKQQQQGEALVIASAEGRLHLVSRVGRVERSVEAHRGAVLAARWSGDGTALATAGEDGLVKIWSRSGMLRSTLVQQGSPVYSACWSPDSDRVLHTAGRHLVVKPLQPGARALQWKAHEGLVLKVDWNAVNGLVVSGGEDCRYKVWDSYGCPLYSSLSHEHPVTAVAWAPDGSLFLVGAFDTLRLCDRAGWSHCLEKLPGVGSPLGLAWSHDGTQVGAACGSGRVVFAHLLERRWEWAHLEVTLTKRRTMQVRNVLDDAVDTLEFRDRVIRASLGHGHLVVATCAQCYVYSIKNWNTPIIFDLKEGSVSLIVQAQKHFVLVQAGGGGGGAVLLVSSYEGRAVAVVRGAGLRAELLEERTLALSDDTIAVRDPGDTRVVLLFEALSGKPVGDGTPLTHKLEVVQVALDASVGGGGSGGGGTGRLLALLDRAQDVFVVHTRGAREGRPPIKIGGSAQCVAWHGTAPVLCGVGDGRLSLWLCPAAAFADPGLAPATVRHRDAPELGKCPRVLSFLGARVSVRRADGALLSVPVSPYPGALHGLVAAQRWDHALRLCRFVKDPALWACLAALAVRSRELETAEAAYAAIGEVDRVAHVRAARELPVPESRWAALALLSGDVHQAEGILLQGGLTYRAIRTHIDLYSWDRALELAVKHKTHVDSVLAFRQRHLQQLQQRQQQQQQGQQQQAVVEETRPRFLQYARQVEVDWEKVEAKIELELQKEKERGVAAAAVTSTVTTQGARGGHAVQR